MEMLTTIWNKFNKTAEVTAACTAMLCSALISQSVEAQTILRVDKFRGTDLDDDPNVNGSGWEADAFKFLQDALVDARDIVENNPGSKVEIWVAGYTGQLTISKVYYPYESSQSVTPYRPPDCTDVSSRCFSFPLINNVSMYGGFNSEDEPTLRNQRDPDQYKTVLSGVGGSQGTYHIVAVASESAVPIDDTAKIEGGQHPHEVGE